jgi:anti-anti-sigma regulatory factor
MPPTTVALQGPLTIERAAAVKEALGKALAAASIILVDISSAEDIDLAGLQVLYAARAEAKAGGKELHFAGTMPARVVKRLSSCGFLRGVPGSAAEFETALVGF